MYFYPCYFSIRNLKLIIIKLFDHNGHSGSHLTLLNFQKGYKYCITNRLQLSLDYTGCTRCPKWPCSWCPGDFSTTDRNISKLCGITPYRCYWVYSDLYHLLFENDCHWLIVTNIITFHKQNVQQTKRPKNDA